MRKKIALLFMMLFICIAFSSIPVAAKVKISSSSVSMVKGDKKQLKVTGTKSKVKWTSGNKKIATVSSKGVVTAKKKGQTAIYASVNGKKYSCNVTVYNAGEYFNRKCKDTVSDDEIFLYTMGGTSQGGNIPSIIVANVPNAIQAVPIRFMIENYSVFWIYVDHVYAKIAHAQSGYIESLNVTGSFVKKGKHTVEVVQYENDDPTKKVTLYKKMQYNVLYS